MSSHPIDIPSKPYGFPPEAFDPSRLPDVDTNFLPPEHLEAFIQALSAPDEPTQTTAAAAAAAGGRAAALSPSSPSSPADTTAARRDRPGGRRDGRGQGEDEYEEDEDPQAVAAQAAAAADVTAPGEPRPQGGGQQAQTQQQQQHRGSSSSSGAGGKNLFITAANDWAPVHERVKGKGGGSKKRRRTGAGARGAVGGRARKTVEGLVGTRSKDETREGYLYGLLKWPFLLIVGAWIVGLGVAYVATRLYIWLYEHFVAWRGTRDKLRRAMRATSRYEEWVAAAKRMDQFLGNKEWKEEEEFAYYDSVTVRRVWEQMRKCRAKAERAEQRLGAVENGEGEGRDRKDVEDLKALIEACVKNNFVGVENPRLYSQTYYGTKNLVQNFVDEVEKSVRFMMNTRQLTQEEKRHLFKGMHANYGRTALCLSGGASFAYYHFGVVKALLEADLLPDVITGTSGGALVAGLVATRTNDELKQLLVPALSHKITACSEPITVWFRRWWRTGARFDSVDWAKLCSWWTRGSMTFREAYERTGRILNVSCVPADPHSPTILCNYLTSPDCVIWSAVLASAAVPGILNPVVLMMKTRGGQLVPYSFGHKWKDGSLRTDIPIKALNLHFNVNFTIVSQVNPHINLFFFSSRGSVGSPVTHRRGRGWRGGYLGSATEQYLKLDLNKWLKVLRHLELLPRPLGQDWSQIWLQQFVGTITIWPRSVPSDFVHILDDPNNARLARMIHEGQQSAFPKLKFVANRLKVERLVERGRRETRPHVRRGSIETIISEDDLRNLLRGQGVEGSATETGDESTDAEHDHHREGESAVLDGEDSGVEGLRLRIVPGKTKVAD